VRHGGFVGDILAPWRPAAILDLVSHLAPALASLALVAGLAVTVHARRHQAPGAVGYAFLLWAQAAWLVGYVGELVAPDLARKQLWDDVTWIPCMVTGAAILHFAGSYSGRRRLASVLALGYALAASPVTLWIVTERLHPGLRGSARVLDAPPFGALVYDFTTADFAASTLVVVATAIGVAMVLVEARFQRGGQRAGGLALAAGAGGPMTFAYVAYFAGITWQGQRDVAPLSFGLFGLVSAWALLRGRAFDLVPVARERVLEVLSDAVLVLDAHGRVVDANPRARSLLGSAGPDGEPPRTPAFAALEAVLAGGAGSAGLDLPGGRFDVRVSPVGEVEDRPAAIAVVLHDVSELTRANDALRAARDDLERRVAERTAEVLERERTLRAIFENSLQLMGLVAPDGRLLSANPAALAMAGVTEAEVVGLPFWDTPWWRGDAGQQAALREGFERACRGEVFRMLARHPGVDGRGHEVEFSLKPVPGENGRVAAILAEGRDLSELRQGERERRSLKERLQHAQKLESLGRLAGGVAHDFNNLLTAIAGNAALAREECAPGSTASAALDELLHATQTASSLTRQLLAFGRKQPGGVQRVEVAAALERMRSLLVRLLGEDVRLEVTCAAGTGQVLMDPGQLEQVIVNLAVNARDAMPGGGTLTLAAEARQYGEVEARARGVDPGRWVLVQVKDDGVGMDEEVRSRLFEPFFTTKPEGKGTGLGLATVYGIVRSSGGVIEVESAPGRGSRFVIHLPRAEGLAQAEPGGEPAALPRGRERVLVAEDRPEVGRVVARILAGCGYEVTLTRGAAEALERLAAEPPDLLLTDVRMPDMDGPALAREARRRRPGLPVLFMSGNADATTKDDAGERILAKPFTPGSLAAAVREAIDRARGAAA